MLVLWSCFVWPSFYRVASRYSVRTSNVTGSGRGNPKFFGLNPPFKSILPHTENKGIVGAIRWSRGKGKAGKLVFVQLSWLSGRALAAQARVRLQVTANLFTFLYFHLITSIVLYIGKGWPFVVTWQIVQCVLLHTYVCTCPQECRATSSNHSNLPTISRFSWGITMLIACLLCIVISVGIKL